MQNQARIQTLSIKTLLPLLVLLALPVAAIAQTTHYIRASASFGGNGSDWTRALRDLPETLQRGHVYYVADGDYDEYVFNDDESGSTPIVIRKATPGDHGTDTGWQDSYGDGQAVFGPLNFLNSYYEFDGQTGGGPGSWDSGHGFKITRGGAHEKLVRLGDSFRSGPQPTDIKLHHIEFEHRGLDTETGDDCVYNWAAGPGLGPKNIEISHCYMHDAGRTFLLTQQAENFLLEYNYFARNSSSSGQHSEAWSDFGSRNNIVRYNRFEDIEGTGFIIFQVGRGDNSSNWEIYGNLFYYTDTNPTNRTGTGGNGCIGSTTPQNGGYTNNIKVYNNTFSSIPGLNAGVYLVSGTGNVVYNNLWYRCDNVNNGNSDHNYNTYIDTALSWSMEPGPNDQFAAFLPFLSTADEDFRLSEPTAPGFSSLSGPLATDLEGQPRGADGVWDRGAHEYTGVLDSELPTAPTRLIALAIGESYLEFQWDPSSDNYAVAGYRIYRGSTFVGSTPETKFRDTNLASDTSYNYRVRAYDTVGNESPYSTILTMKTIPNVTPPGFVGLSVTADTLRLEFDEALDPDPVGNGAAASVTLTPDPGIADISLTNQGRTILLQLETSHDFSRTYELRAEDIADIAGNPAETIVELYSYRGNTADNGLIGHWWLDDGTGSVAKDISGFDNDGTVQGGTWVPGYKDGGLSFDGKDDFITPTASPLFDQSTDQFSVTLWVCFNLSARTEFLVDKGGLQKGFYIRRHIDNTILFKLDDGQTEYYAQSNEELAQTQHWHHIAGVVDGRDAVRLYIDGVEQSRSFYGPLSQVGGIDNGSALTFGVSTDRESYFNGILDDIRIYDRALSPEEIDDIIAADNTKTASDRAWQIYE